MLTRALSAFLVAASLLTSTSAFSAGAVVGSSLTIDDGVSDVAAGGSTTYTVTLSMNEAPPVSSTFQIVTQVPLPAEVQSASWTCSAAGEATCGAASGTGALSDISTFAYSGSVASTGTLTYLLQVVVKPAASGTLTVEATAVSPVNGSVAAVATPDVDNITQAVSADLQLTQSTTPTAKAGDVVTFTVIATNAGPDPVTGASLSSTLPATLENASWTCVASAGASCAASGSGSLSDAVDLPLNGTVTYTLTATVSSQATGNIDHTVNISASSPDPDTANNAATSTITLAAPVAVVPPATAQAVPSQSTWALGLLSLVICGSLAWRRRALSL